MWSDILGEDLLGDDDVGADDLGDELGDYLVGDDILGDDILGDDLLGDDLVGDYLVGAGPKRAPVARRRQVDRKAALKKALRLKRLQAAKLVHKRSPSKSRIQGIGFSRPAVPASTSVEITARPQVLFRGTRLIVGSSIAESFVIDDIKVGRNSQFVGTGGQPAEAYRETATGDNVSLDTCQPGVDITLVVTNVTGAAVDFRASLFGDAIE